MKLRLPHKFQAALMAAIASVSFTTLSSASLGTAFFLANSAAAEDSATADADEIPEFNIGYTDLEASPEESDKQQQIEVDQASIKTIKVGSNGMRGSSDDADRNLTVTVDEDGTDTTPVAAESAGSPILADSSAAAATPADDLGFTSNPYATGSDTSNGSDDFSLTGTAPAAAYVPGQSGISAEEGDSAAGTGSGSSTNKTTTGAIGSIGGTGSGGIGGSVARPMALTAPNMLSPVSSLSVGGTSLGGDSGFAPALATSLKVGAAGSSAASPITTLGNIMYIGDSITNGHGGRISWRWDMFKLLTDNGVTQVEEGIKTGRNGGDSDHVGATYGGSTFDNRHSAQSSGRAWEISGRKSGGRYGNSNIMNWLGQSGTKTDGQPYTGNVYSDTAPNATGGAPDTFVMMIGINDYLSDGFSNEYDVHHNLLGYNQATDSFDGKLASGSGTCDYDVIYNSMRTANPDAVIYISKLTPEGSSGNCSTEKYVEALNNFNALLVRWAAEKNAKDGQHIVVLDPNAGIVDVTNSLVGAVSKTVVPGFGNPAFYDDGLHPSVQGELIISGNIAKGMGLGGRTAGQYRKAATDFSQQISAVPAGATNVTLNDGALDFGAVGDSSATFAWDSADLTHGSTVEFSLLLGNGETGGWDTTTDFAITLDDGSHAGTLNINEAYIKWGSKLLYSQDSSLQGNEAIRIAYVNGNAAESLDGGFYVWLGDMMIGEALSASSSTAAGVTMSYSGSGTALVSALAMEGTGSFAPNTSRSYNADYAFISAGTLDTKNTSQGLDPSITWSATNNKFALPSGQSSMDPTLYREFADTIGAAYTGAANAPYTGSIGMRYCGTGNQDAQQGVLSVYSATVTGDVRMQFDSPNTVYNKWSNKTAEFASVVGTYNGNITGSYTAVFNAGTFLYNIYGGSHTGNTRIGGGTRLFINDGTYNANIYGGGRVASTIENGTAVTITGGKIAGSVYGGGLAGTITGGTSVTVTGGYIAGNVYGGMAGETDGHYTGSVTVQDNLAVIQGNIYAAEVTFKGISTGTSKYGPAHYAGQIHATDTFNLDNYTASDIRAAIATKNLVLKNGTKTTIHNLTLTACTITVEDTSEGTIASTLTLGNTATYTGNLTLADGLIIDMDDSGGSGGGSVYSDGENGFREASEITVMQRGTSGSLDVDPTKLTGAGVLADSTFTYNSGTGALTAAVQGERDTYYVNTGTVVYGGPRSATDITTATKVQMQPTVGATLELAQNLTTDCTAGIVVASSAVNPVVKIDKFESDGTTRIVLDQADLHANAAVKLAGDGTFALNANSFVLPEHVSLDSDWAGAVRVSGSATGLNIATLGNNIASTIEFAGVTGDFASHEATNQTLTRDVIFTNDGNKSAVQLNNGYSRAGAYEFSGKVSGDGTFELNKSGVTYHIIFSGDVSDWNGEFKVTSSNANITWVKFADDAKVVSAAINNSSNLALMVDTDAVFNANVTGINKGLTVSAGHYATFNGSTTSISGDSTIGGTVYNGGSMTLDGTVNVDLSNPNAFELYNAETGGNTYSDVDSGFLTSENVHYYLVKGNENSTLLGDPAITGSSITGSSKEGNSLVISAQKDSGLYYVNRDLSYDSTKMVAATGFVIKKDTTLSAVDNSALGGSAKQLHGTGTYALASGAKALNGNLSLGSDWAGAVKISGSITDLDLSAGTNLYNGHSSVILDGWTGYFKQASQNIAADVEIGMNGITLTNGWAASVITFEGALTGSGDIVRNNDANVSPDLRFTGDVSGYTGDIINYRNHASHGFRLTFSDDANQIKAGEIKNDSGVSGKITIAFTADDTVVDSVISKNSGTIDLTVGADTTFNAVVSATTLTVNNGATATLKAASALGSLAGAGTLVVDSGSDAVTLSGSGGHTGRIDVVTGTLDVRSVNAMGSGHVTVQDGATVDLQQSGMNNAAVVTQMGSGQISGGGDVLVSNTGEFVFSGNGTTNLTANYVFTGANAPEFNGHGYDSDGHTLNIGGQNTTASISTQTSDLRVESGLKARVLAGGALTVAGNLVLGHNTATNPGMLEIAGGDVKVAGINLVNTTNSLTMTDGTFEVTKAGNAFTGNSTGNNTVELTGGTLKATQNSWTLNHNATLGDIGVETSAGNTLTIGASGLTTTLTGIIDNSGTLALAGTMNVTKDADEGSTGERYSEGDNGFLITGSSSYTLVSGNTGASQLTADGVEWQINGTAATGATLENGVLVTAGTQGTEYFVNSGDVVYKDSSNHTGEAAGLTLNGGNLIVNEALNSGVRISVAAGQATPTTSGLTVGGSVSLNQDSFGTVAGDFNLTGTVSVGLNTLNTSSTAGSALMQHAQGGTLYLNSLGTNYYSIADSATAATGTLKSGLGSANVVDLTHDWNITSFEKVSIENGKNMLFRMSNAARTVSMETLEVDTASTMGLFGTANSYGGTFNMGNLAGNGNLVLYNGSGAGDKTATFNLGNGEGTNSFTGSIELQTVHPKDNNTGQVVKVVLNDATVAAGADIQFNALANSTVALEVATDTSVKGIKDKSLNGTRSIAAIGEGTHSLTVTGEATYSTAASVGAGLGIAMTGNGSQSFTGDLSAMNGAVTATAGTLTLDNSGSTGSLASATVDGGTLKLDNMNVTNAVTLSSGTLDLLSSTTIGSLNMTGGTLKLAGENSLTSTGTIAFSGASTLNLTNISLSGTSPVTLATTGGITGDLSAVTLTGLTAPEGYKGVLTQDSNNLVLTFVATSKDLIWDNHASDNQWSTSANWHTEADDTTHIAFTDGDNVRFTTGYTNTSSLSTNVSTGDMTLDSNVTVNLTANSHSLTVDGTLNLGAGSTLEVDSGSRGIAVNLDSVAVDGSASLTSKSGGWNPHFSIGAVEGSAGSVLNLKTNSTVRVATVYDMNGGENSDFHGNIVLRQEQTSATGRRLLAMNINPGAATQLADSVVTLSNVSNEQTRIGLGVNTDATIKGLVSDAGSTAGKHVVFSGQATKDTQDEFNNNINNSGVVHTLTIATDGDNYSTRADVLANVNLVKTGTGSQSFTSDLSAMNGAVTATAGTLTLANSGNKGNLNSVMVDGGTLELNNMGVTNAITLSSGKLDLLSATSTGSLNMTGGMLVMDDQNWLTSSTGSLAFTSGRLDLSGMNIQAGSNYTLATGGSVTLGSMDFTISPELQSQYELKVQGGNTLVLSYIPPEPTEYLVWQGGPGTWDTETDNKVWYPNKETTTTKVAFETEDNVAFMVPGDSPVTVADDLTAGYIRVDEGVNLTLENNADGAVIEATKVTVSGNVTAENVALAATSMQLNETGSLTVDIAEGVEGAEIAARVSGSGDFTKTGKGSLELSGTNTGYTGTATIEAGTLVAGNSAGKALGNAPDVVLAGGDLAGTVAPTGNINITSTADGTVSANITVADGAVLTFNTTGTTTITESGVISGAGDIVKDGTGTLVLASDNTYTGNLDINQGTVMVSSAGALSGTGKDSVKVHEGSVLTFVNQDTQTPIYTADYISLDRGSTLTFAGENKLDIGTLYLTANSSVDLSNININHYGNYVLATVDEIKGSEAAVYNPNKEAPAAADLIQFVSMKNFAPAEGFTLTQDSLVSLHYRNGELILEVNRPTEGFYWQPSEDTGVTAWNTSDTNWSTTAALEDDVKFENLQYNTTYKEYPYSAFFLSAGQDGKEVIDVTGLSFYSRQQKKDMPGGNVHDMIIANGVYTFTNESGGVAEMYVTNDDNRLSNFVVRSGAKAHFDAVAVNGGENTVMHICDGAVFTMENIHDWSTFSVNNEGITDVEFDGAISGVVDGMLSHVDNYSTMSVTTKNMDQVYTDYCNFQIGEVMNREGALLVLAAPKITANSTYGDGIIHNAGNLILGVTTEDGRVINLLPVLDGGVFETVGNGMVVEQAGEVRQTSATLGAKTTELSGGATVGSTSIAASSSAILAPNAKPIYDEWEIQIIGYEMAEKNYALGPVTSGADSTLEVQKGATVTADSYNADLVSDTPTGKIVVGPFNKYDWSETMTTATLTVNGVTKAAELEVQDGGVVNLVGEATVTTLTQSGGTANFNAGGFVGGGNVSGGTLDIDDGKVLTLGDVITETGNYTVAATTGTINADALELHTDWSDAGYLEVHHTADQKTTNQSGFVSGGEQYVQVFDIKGGSLTANDVIVTHKDAAGPMTLISSNDQKHPERAGCGYLDTEQTIYTTYYVRDNYVTGAHGTRSGDDREADYVKLSQVIATATAGGETLAAVVFDQTGYNNAVDGSAAYHGTLTVDTNTKADLFHVTEEGTEEAPDTTRAAINIAENVVVLADQNYAGVEGQLDLTGAGVYQIDNRGDLGTKVSLLGTTTDGITPWQGTVRLTGAAEDVDMRPLSVGEGEDASTIEFKEWTGSFLDTEDPMVSNAKILLTGTGVVGKPAISLTEGDANLKWTNTVNGQGARIDHAEGGNFSLEMTGDTSEWNGTFTQSAAGSTVSLGFLLDAEHVSSEHENATIQNADVLASAGQMDVTYGGDLKTVNGNATVYGTGDMNLMYTGTDMQVNSNISKYNGQGTMDVTVGDEDANEASATFNGDITANTLTVETNAAATLHNTTEISQTVAVDAGASLSIQNAAGTGMATITSGNDTGNAQITGGVTMKSDDGKAIISGTAGEEWPATRVDGADVAVLSAAASLQIENLVLAADTMVHGTGNVGSLVISDTVVQKMSSANAKHTKSDSTITSALTMTGTTGTTLEYENDKVYNVDFTSMCQMAQISGSAGTLVFDFTEMPEYSDWEHKFSAYGFVGVNFDMADKAIDASELTVKALTKDAQGQTVERIGYYYNGANGGSGAVVGSIIYFQVPEPTTGTLSLLALCALAARRRRK